MEGCEPLCPGLVSDAGGVWVAARGDLNAEKPSLHPARPGASHLCRTVRRKMGMRLEGRGRDHDCPGPVPEGTQSVGKLC